MSILVLKSLHIISFVGWIGGLFYLARILAYHAKAINKSEAEKNALIKQFKIIEWQVYKKVCSPTMMITWTCGLIMLHLYGVEWLKENPWMHIKLTLLTILTIYHVWLGKEMKHTQKETPKFSSIQYSLFNLIPILILFTVVLLAGLREMSFAGYIFGSALVVGILLFLGIKNFEKK